jgi:hypothetical protein
MKIKDQMNIHPFQCHPNTVNDEEFWMTYMPHVAIKNKKKKTCKLVKWKFVLSQMKSAGLSTKRKQCNFPQVVKLMACFSLIPS